MNCPGCEGEELEKLPGRRWLCRPCNLEMTTDQAEGDDWYYLISIPFDGRPDRVELGAKLDAERELLSKRAEIMNENHRSNARRARVIDRGQFGEARANRPTTLAQVFAMAEGRRE